MSVVFASKLPSILWDVVEEHLDEAEFLVDVCRRSAVAPDYTPPELRDGPFARLSAHLDALSIAGPEIVDPLLGPALEDDTFPERVTASALAWLALPEPMHPLELLRRSSVLSSSAATAVAEAAAWSLHPTLDRELAALGRGTSPELLPLVLRMAAHRAVPVDLEPVMRSDEPELLALGVQAARTAKSPKLLAWAESLLRSSDEALVAAATETAFGWESRLAWHSLEERAFHADADAAARLAALGERSYTEQFVKWLSQDDRRPAAVWALGFSGWPRAAQVCLELLDHDDRRTACLAGEAFASITGLPLDDERYWGETAEELAALEGDELPELEDDLQAELDLGPEDALPLPRADEIRRWWSERHERFKPTMRYLLGRPRDAASLVWALREAAPMRRRPILALLLAAQSPNSLWVPTRCSPHLTERRLAAALPPGR